ncbi:MULTISPECIES: MbtH family NRPS accessory protein [unclassified Methylobacterium]|jgi:MbtH protein|uniref:MbtH family protein n=1 Tax=unclassified Methylobacterium TaxID=2615210 RepID=UPI0006F4E4CD|nr:MULTISPECIES: MbtH family NRPS accessory protein [unclassified Methylobacterium]KQP77106.1 antibiotic synthesis protein MbtH [Methylobacterium sp. Leaf113]MCK2056765.1 MbtH family NRPS accessory protein [Methylobacterium sp. 37f]
MAIDDSEATFLVVLNHEAQYSIWPSFRPVPQGWAATGYSGIRADCLAHIDTVWTDMRPASLRRALDGDAPAPRT